MNICKKCLWFYTSDRTNPFCDKQRTEKVNTCSRYYFLPEEQRKHETAYIADTTNKKCHCGTDAAGGGDHSDYCPKYVPSR